VSKELVVKDKESKKALEAGRDSFRKMQESWFYFGKAVHAIYQGEHFRAIDEDLSFREYCEQEYKSISYSNIMKMVNIVEDYGELIESRMKKDSAYKIPAYDDCYYVVMANNREDLPKEEVSKLKKDILDGKLYFLKLREKFKELISAHSKKTREEVVASAAELEKRLVKDIEGEDLDAFDEEDFTSDDDEDETESEELEDIDEDEDADLKSAIAATQARVDYLNDNLRDLLKRVEAEGASDEAAELCERMDKLYGNIDKFLVKYEEINNE